MLDFMGQRVIKKVDVIVTFCQFRDGMYCWTSANEISEPMGLSRMIAIGKWFYKIDSKEIEIALNTLLRLSHDIAVFRNGKFSETYMSLFQKEN
jgi:hypothetical protein